MAGTPVETCWWEYCEYNTSWALRCIWLVILCSLDLTLMHGRQTERVYKVLMCLIFLKHKSSGLCSMQCAILSSVAFRVVQYFSTLFYSTFCTTQCICVLCGSENKQPLFPYIELTVFRTHFSYIKDVYVFGEWVFSHLILVYFACLHIKIHNMDHTISEYQLSYGPFHLYNSPFLTYDACKKLSRCFQF